MKVLLVIPVMALFLSNVPFRMEMNMPSSDDESCMMEKQEAMQCSSDGVDSKPESCCKKETTCVCFYCFQLLAPTQSISKFRFHIAEQKSLNGFYLQAHWIDPFIDGLLQPPDMV